MVAALVAGALATNTGNRLPARDHRIEDDVDKDFLKDRGIDNQAIRELAEKLADSVPDADGFKTLRADLERNFRSLLAGAFERLDLVTREEFDVQRKVLQRTREKLTALEAELKILEERLSRSDPD